MIIKSLTPSISSFSDQNENNLSKQVKSKILHSFWINLDTSKIWLSKTDCEKISFGSCWDEPLTCRAMNAKVTAHALV